MTTYRRSYSPRTDPTQLPQVLFDELSHRYHEERQRRIANDNPQMHVHNHPGDAGSLLNLALNWAPYGGVPEEEVFERYGTTLARFVDQLWVIVRHLHCDRMTVAKLSAVYPKRRTSLETGRGVVTP